MSVRMYWVEKLCAVCRPVMENLSRGTLRSTMPVQKHPQVESRLACSHLEAFGRALAGLAPWLEAGNDTGREGDLRAEMTDLTRRALEQAVDPEGPDYLFSFGGSGHEPQQPLVDSSYVALGLLRARTVLWDTATEQTRRRLCEGLRHMRRIPCHFNNWLLFAAMNEALLAFEGEEDWDFMRVDYAVRAHEMRYKGDGIYGDGLSYMTDYYNSYVIHPYLLEILDALCGKDGVPDGWVETWWEPMRDRLTRYAEILERLISPGGEYPPQGRSLVYRCGAFQALAMAALRGWLPDSVNPAQVRCALTAVIQRTLDAPGTFDENGWLRIGLCGDQPSLGERYISTGSLYMASLAFLPLGLDEDDPFWKDPNEDWTQVKAWSGVDIPNQHGLDDFSKSVGGITH